MGTSPPTLESLMTRIRERNEQARVDSRKWTTRLIRSISPNATETPDEVAASAFEYYENLLNPKEKKPDDNTESGGSTPPPENLG